jgi:hypothetical protein
MERYAALLVLLACACSGKQSSDTPTKAPFTAYLPAEPGPDAGLSSLEVFCLPASFPVTDAGLPNCVVVRAMFPNGTGTAQEIDACRACAAPGESHVPASISLASISPDLAGYSCVCAVSMSAPCPDRAPTLVDWCALPVGSHRSISLNCQGNAGLNFASSLTWGAAVYVACFAP